MKCIDCGKNVGNWPNWLEGSCVTVRCKLCSSAFATPVNVPKEHTVMFPVRVPAPKVEEVAKAA